MFAGRELLAFAANRAHHADVRGSTTGSMPADSRTLVHEAVVIEPLVLDDDAISQLSEQMRQPAQRRAGLRAQLAATRVGTRRQLELLERVGRETIGAAFKEVLDYSERRTRACLDALEDGVPSAKTCSRQSTTSSSRRSKRRSRAIP